MLSWVHWGLVHCVLAACITVHLANVCQSTWSLHINQPFFANKRVSPTHKKSVHFHIKFLFCPDLLYVASPGSSPAPLQALPAEPWLRIPWKVWSQVFGRGCQATAIHANRTFSSYATRECDLYGLQMTWSRANGQKAGWSSGIHHERSRPVGFMQILAQLAVMQSFRTNSTLFRASLWLTLHWLRRVWLHKCVVP